MTTDALDVPVDRRQALRAATREAHQVLDRLATALDLTAPHEYAIFLLANATPLFALETALERGGVDTLLTDWPQRSRRNALARDLARFDLVVSEPPSPTLTSQSEQLGVLYVLEGSRLGAQLLSRRVAQSADEAVLAARAFLQAGDSAQWRSFVDVLETAEPIDADAMIAAALRAFDLYRIGFANALAAHGKLVMS